MATTEKAKIKIGDKEYIIEDLSNEAKAQIQNIIYVNNKIADLQAQIATLNAAKEYYTNILKNLVTNEENKNHGEEEKIKFS